MSTCNRLDLQTLGSQPIMPKNLPNHWLRAHNSQQLIPQSFNIRTAVAGLVEQLGTNIYIYLHSFLHPELTVLGFPWNIQER